MIDFYLLQLCFLWGAAALAGIGAVVFGIRTIVRGELSWSHARTLRGKGASCAGWSLIGLGSILTVVGIWTAADIFLTEQAAERARIAEREKRRSNSEGSSLLRRAESLLGAGAEDRARKALEEVIRLRPPPESATLAEAHSYMSGIHARAGAWKRAVASIDASLELAPRDGDNLATAAFLLASCPDEEFRDLERAEALAERSLQLLTGSDRWHGLEAAAAVEAMHGNFKRAEELQRKAVTAYESQIRELQSETPLIPLPMIDRLETMRDRARGYQFERPYVFGETD